MSTRIKRLVARLATLALVIGLVPSTSLSDTTGESIPTDVDDRWIPSFAIRSGVTFQYMDASARSHCQNGRPQEPVQAPGTSTFINRNACSDPNMPTSIYDPDPAPVMPDLFDPLCPSELSADGRRACLRPSVEDDQLAATPFVSGSLELMTPRVGFLPGRPRLFVGGEIMTLFAQERNVAKESNPKALAFPAEGGAPRATGVPGPTLNGTGSVVRSQVQRLGYAAHTGFAVPFEFRERRLWLKPSFGWFQYEVDFESHVVAAIKPDPLLDVTAASFAPGIREITFFGKGSETFDSIGPGLELEMEVGRYGPLGVSLFLNFEAFWVLGERSFSFSDSLTCPAFDPNDEFGGCAPADLLQQLGGSTSPFVPVPGAHRLVDLGNDPMTPPELRPMAGDTYDADFEFGVDPIVYRGGLGIRFSWLGR